MANVKNAFSLLAGGGDGGDQAFQAAKSKKKNKKKVHAEPVDGAAQQAAPSIKAATPPAAAPQPQTAYDAGLALEAAAVAAVSGERGALAAEWTEQVRGRVDLRQRRRRGWLRQGYAAPLRASASSNSWMPVHAAAGAAWRHSVH